MTTAWGAQTVVIGTKTGVLHGEKQGAVVKSMGFPWLVWLSILSSGPRIQGSLVQFQVRAKAWVAGPVPSREHARGNHTLMFLSLFLSPYPSLKNK